MAQALSDIYNSLNSGGYDQQRQAINAQMASLPSYYQAQQSGLDQTEANQFKAIDNGAAARGMFYSGAPIQERQQYVGGTYLPVVAQLKQQQNQQQYGLQQALAGVSTAQTNAAQGILQNQIQNDQQNNYYNQMLAQNAQYNQRMASMYGGGGSGSSGGSGFAVGRDNSGGFQFTNAGKPITAAQYAQGTGTTVQNLLQQMNTPGAQSLLQKMAAAKTASQQNALKQQYSYIFGGV